MGGDNCLSGNGLTVRKIKDGTVIDHIPVGRALKVLKLLGIEPSGEYRIALVMNVESKKIGRKDIVKIENLELDSSDMDKIALVAPTATINIIRDYRVERKEYVKPPREVEGILKCINPTCISRQGREHIKSRFRIVREEPLTYQCIYCGSLLEEGEIINQLSR